MTAKAMMDARRQIASTRLDLVGIAVTLDADVWPRQPSLKTPRLNVGAQFIEYLFIDERFDSDIESNGDAKK
jgi:hypothetical protein